MTLEERIAQLKQAQGKLRQRLAQAAKDATIRAVEKAAELTPPEADDLSGTNTRSGAMKQHWATDSVLTPQKQADRYVTELANDLEYASYVNDGHRMGPPLCAGACDKPLFRYAGIQSGRQGRHCGGHQDQLCPRAVYERRGQGGV